MISCCDRDAASLFMLNAGGELVGLTGVRQAFQNVGSLGLTGEEAAERLMEIVGRKNYIPECAEKEYKIALLSEYNKYLAKT